MRSAFLKRFLSLTHVPIHSLSTMSCYQDQTRERAAVQSGPARLGTQPIHWLNISSLHILTKGLPKLQSSHPLKQGIVSLPQTQSLMCIGTLRHVNMMAR